MHSPTPSPGGRRERWSSRLYERCADRAHPRAPGEKKIEYCKMNGQRTGKTSKRIAARNRRIDGVAEYHGWQQPTSDSNRDRLARRLTYRDLSCQ